MQVCLDNGLRLLPLDAHPVNQDVVIVVISLPSNSNLKFTRSGAEASLYIVPLLVVICLVAKLETFCLLPAVIIRRVINAKLLV